MKIVKIDPSVATRLEIDPLVQNERRPILFTAEIDWPGQYSLRVWNSDGKQIEYTMPTEPEKSLEVSGTVMKWWIDATAQNTPPGKYYAEIYSTNLKAVIYKAEYQILN